MQTHFQFADIRTVDGVLLRFGEEAYASGVITALAVIGKVTIHPALSLGTFLPRR